jgi:hypothetical protein
MNETEYGVYIEYPWSTRPILVEDCFFSREEAEAYGERLWEKDKTIYWDGGAVLVYEVDEVEQKLKRRNS